MPKKRAVVVVYCTIMYVYGVYTYKSKMVYVLVVDIYKCKRTEPHTDQGTRDRQAQQDRRRSADSEEC